MVQEVAEADSPTLSQATGEELADPRFEAELPLRDQLHHDRGDEALGHAADPEPVVRASGPASELGDAGRDHRPLTVPFNQRDHGRDLARLDQHVGGLLELAPTRCRRREDDGGERKSCDEPACGKYAASTRARYSVTFTVLGVYEGAMASDVSFGLPLPLARGGSDAELLARAIRGDHDAYADLVRPHERVAYRVAAAITGGSADAEEAMQNAFVKAYRSLHRFRSGAPFRPWLLKIVVREAHNVLRAERRHTRLGARAAEQHRPEAAGPDEALIAREEVETVLGALARLPRSDRVALALRYFAELPDKDAAALLGTTAQAYRVRLVRARRRLQDLLEERRHDD